MVVIDAMMRYGSGDYIADIGNVVDRNRRFVRLGTASSVGLLAGPAFGAWLAGPVVGQAVAQMPSMVNWLTLVAGIIGISVLLLEPWCVGSERHAAAAAPASGAEPAACRHFVRTSMLLALLAAFAVGTFEVGFKLFGGQTLGLASGTISRPRSARWRRRWKSPRRFQMRPLWTC